MDESISSIENNNVNYQEPNNDIIPIEPKKNGKGRIKKILLLVLVLFILGGTYYIYSNTNLLKIKDIEILTLTETNTGIDTSSLGETEQANILVEQNTGTVAITGEVEITSTTDIGQITGLYEDNLTLLIGEGRENNDDCSTMIGNIKELKDDIKSNIGSVIDNLAIRNFCGDKSNYSSNLDDYKENFKNHPQYLKNLIQENENYIIYSLINNGWDMYYMEYPVIIYDKENKTNTLLTIRTGVPEFEYLDNNGNLIIALNKEEGISREVLNIKSKSVLGSYDSIFRDCGDKSLVTNKKNVVLHNFSEDKCGYDFESRDIKKEQELKGKLTITNDTSINDYYAGTILGKFQSNDLLHATNDDIIDSVKGNTLIFHINDIRYEIIDDKLVNK